MLEVKAVKVSEKGQIAIPVEIRDKVGIKKGDTLIIVQEGNQILIKKAAELAVKTRDEFDHLLSHSEKVADEFWGSKEDDVWDNI